MFRGLLHHGMKYGSGQGRHGTGEGVRILYLDWQAARRERNARPDLSI